MTETRFYEPASLSTPPKPLFSLKPLDATAWLRSLLSKVFRQDKDDLSYDARTINKGQKVSEIKVRFILYEDQQLQNVKYIMPELFVPDPWPHCQSAIVFQE